MKITIACIGYLKRSPELELIETYKRRFDWEISIKEFEIKKPLGRDKLKEEEAKLLLSAVPKGAYLVALDERGKQFSSLKFADFLKNIQVQGVSSIVFLLGGADGHCDKVLTKADFLLSMGEFTWPHMLARVMLVEQLYRVQQIIKGHPYHRE